MSDYDDDSVTNNLRDSANGTFVSLDDFSPLTLNEVSDWGHDVWDLNGIHALTAVPSQAELTHCRFTKPRSIAVAPCQRL